MARLLDTKKASQLPLTIRLILMGFMWMVFVSHEEIHDNMCGHMHAIGLQENYDTNIYGQSVAELICPCGATSTQQVLSFVGNNYYCEAG